MADGAEPQYRAKLRRPALHPGREPLSERRDPGSQQVPPSGPDR